MATPEQLGEAPPHVAPSVTQARQLLAGVRRRAWWWLVLGRVTLLVAIVLAVVLQAALIDYYLRGPWWLRAGLWIASVVALAAAVRRWVLPAARFWPELVDLALRLEQTPEGSKAGLGGVLASGLELGGLSHSTSEPHESPTARSLKEQAVALAVDRLRQVGGVHLLKPGLARQTLLVMLAIVVALVGVGALAGRERMRIGALRILVPIAGVEWPKRTAVVDATDARVRAIGQTLDLRALLTKTDQRSGRTRVWVNYRMLDDEGRELSPAVRLSLTSRGTEHDVRLADAAGKPASGRPELFEALIEPKLLVGSIDASTETVLEYWFETTDDATSPGEIRLTQPPEVAVAKATIEPPAYASAVLAQGRTALVQGTIDLGPGTDARATVGPVLAGSRVGLDIEFSKPVPMTSPSTEAVAEGERVQQWLASTFPGVDFGNDAQATLEPRRWTIRWSLEKSTRLGVSPVDEHGVAGTREAVFSFDVQTDQPPTVAISKPREDETVLPTAVVDVTGEAKDDVSVASLALERTVARGKAESMGAPPEAEGPAEVFAQWVSTTDGAASEPSGSEAVRAGATVESPLDLAPMNLQPGDEVWVVALANDLFEQQGVAREAIRSQPRKLRIITPQALVDQMRSALATVRESAIRLDEEQAKLQQAVQRGVVTAGERQRQAAMGPRLEQQREAIEKLQERAERNRLDDPGLQGVLEDAQSALDQAQRASDRATARLEQAARGEDPAELNEGERGEVGGQQEAVREELGELIRSLDRGQDNWLVRRDLERLLQQQQELARQTEQLASETTGRSMEELTPRQRTELGSIAERQEQLSDQAMRVMDELAQRAEQLKRNDPAQSQAMRQAAQRGRQQQLQRAMEQAAQQLEQNQTNTAQEQQQRAQQAMEQMLGDLDQAQRSRDQALRRTLESLLESIEALIAAQDRELQILANAGEREAGTKPESGMVRLHTNTLAAADQAATSREMSGVMRLLSEAGEKQVAAIQALRTEPIETESAQAAEQASLERLNEALAEAKRLEEQTQEKDENRQRQELRQAYREALELQTALRAETQGFVGQAVDRRERLKIRVLGDRQDEIRASLEDLRTKTAEIDEAKLFSFAHDRLAGVTASASKRLRAGKADAGTLRDEDSAIAVLRSLVEALARDPKQDEFRESPQGEQGGGGEGGGQNGQQPPSMLPPIAELKLLRAMQQEAAERTKLAGGAEGDDVADEIVAIGEFQRRLAVEGAVVVEKVMQQSQPPEGQGPGGLPEPGGEPEGGSR